MEVAQKVRRNIQLLRRAVSERVLPSESKYLFVVRTMRVPRGEVFGVIAKDATFAADMLAKELGMTPAELLAVTLEVYEQKPLERVYTKIYPVETKGSPNLQECLIVYRGLSDLHHQNVMTEGLKPSAGQESVYTATEFRDGVRFAWSHVKDEGGKPIVYRLSVPVTLFTGQVIYTSGPTGFLTSGPIPRTYILDWVYVPENLDELWKLADKYETEEKARAETLRLLEKVPKVYYQNLPVEITGWENVFPETLGLKPLFDLQTSLIEHKFPHERTMVMDNIISNAGDIYREMTHAYSDYSYVGEKWERLTTWCAKPPLSWLQAGDWEEIRTELQDPAYKTMRDQYLNNLQRLREETLKIPMEPKRAALMTESLDMIKALILWFESQNPYAPPKWQLDRLTDAIYNYFPREFFAGT